jgi:glycosyltransferase involved in cell wall biosynthesis
MKILIVTSMYPSPEKKYSGIFVKNQYEQLQQILKQGEEIELFYMKRTFTSLFGSIKKYILAFFRFIPHYFKKYDVIHLHSFYPLIFVTWLYKLFYPKTKLVVTFHGTDVNQQVNKRNEKLMQFLSKKINFTIPVGKEVAKNVSEKLNLPIGKILPVGVNSNVFYPEKNIKKEYDFLFVGSFILGLISSWLASMFMFLAVILIIPIMQGMKAYVYKKLVLENENWSKED